MPCYTILEQCEQIPHSNISQIPREGSDVYVLTRICCFHRLRVHLDTFTLNLVRQFPVSLTPDELSRRKGFKNMSFLLPHKGKHATFVIQLDVCGNIFLSVALLEVYACQSHRIAC